MIPNLKKYQTARLYSLHHSISATKAFLNQLKINSFLHNIIYYRPSNLISRPTRSTIYNHNPLHPITLTTQTSRNLVAFLFPYSPNSPSSNSTTILRFER